MKKIFTLLAATFLTVATFAADRRPTVTLKTSRNYEVVIDGRSYFTNNGFMRLSQLDKGRHTVKVYEVSRSFSFRKAKRLVDQSTFRLRNTDLNISIDFRGQINVAEDHDRRDDDRGRDWDNGRDNDHDRNRRY